MITLGWSHGIVRQSGSSAGRACGEARPLAFATPSFWETLRSCLDEEVPRREQAAGVPAGPH
jgi:hypothetical protein